VVIFLVSKLMLLIVMSRSEKFLDEALLERSTKGIKEINDLLAFTVIPGVVFTQVSVSDYFA